MNIKAYGAVDRTTQEIILSDNSRLYRINSTQNPLYYRTQTGIYAPINVQEKKVERGNGGDMVLRKASITTVGFKVADDAYKYLGLRPDCMQDGSEQLEFSIQSIEFDGKAQPVDLSRNQAVSPTLTEIGPLVYVQSLRQRTRQLVKVDRRISSFKIVYQINAVGLVAAIRNDIGEIWFYSKATEEFRFRIRPPYLVGMDGEPHRTTDAVKHSIAVNKDGTMLYIKENAIDLSAIEAPYFIDADTVYSSTADGRIRSTQSSPVAQEAWDYTHDATSGDVVSSSESSAGDATLSYKSMFTFVVYNCRIYRSFFYFSLASLVGRCIAASVSLYGVSSGSTKVGIQKGTQADSLSTADVHAFTGSMWGNTDSWNTSGYNTITLNATGLADADAAIGGNLKMCAREYTYDVLDVLPVAEENNYRNGMYYADQTGTSNDPYMLITLGIAGLKTLNSLTASDIKTINNLAVNYVKSLKGM